MHRVYAMRSLVALFSPLRSTLLAPLSSISLSLFPPFSFIPLFSYPVGSMLDLSQCRLCKHTLSSFVESAEQKLFCSFLIIRCVMENKLCCFIEFYYAFLLEDYKRSVIVVNIGIWIKLIFFTTKKLNSFYM